MAIKKKVDDGGSAFPKPTTYAPDFSEIQYGCYGMSLRDYFAGQVMGHFIKEDIDHAFLPYLKKHLSALARTAYAYADAMIDERNKS